MVDFFIHRPVFSTVCALLIILAGAVCIPTLPIAQFPNLAPPQVAVTAVYTGANAQTVESAVTTPLEQAINGAEGMKYMTSSSTNDGVQYNHRYLRIIRDPDLAAVDMQNRVNTADGRLPNEVKQIGVTVDEDFAELRLRRRCLLSRQAGTTAVHQQLSRRLRSRHAQARAGRRRRHDLRRAQVRHAPLARSRTLAGRALTADDVVNALREQNVEVAAGQVGAQAVCPGRNFRSAFAPSAGSPNLRSSRTSSLRAIPMARSSA